MLSPRHSPEALVAAVAPVDLDDIAGHFRSHGLLPIITITVQQAVRLAEDWTPDVCVILGDPRSFGALFRIVVRKATPIVVVASGEQLAVAAEARMPAVTVVLAPAWLDDVARTAEIVACGPRQERPGHVLVRGELRLHDALGVVTIGDENVELPPIEFALLRQLAARPGVAIPTPELMACVWPPESSATQQDVHRHMYRLRRLIDGRRSGPPLIVNRRGFGYALLPPGA